MAVTLRDVTLWSEGALIHRDSFSLPAIGESRSFDHCFLFPGFTDVHVHFREPGFSYKETIRTGALAAAKGGYANVCTMPNLNPVPDSLPHLEEQLEIIRRDACINVLPYGSITVGRAGKTLADMEAMAPYVCGYSDDGSGVQSDDMMLSAMRLAKDLGKLIVAHCEDNSLLKKGGCIHEGRFAAAHGLVGISSESEWRQIARDLELAAKTGCGYHVCHISAKESVELIRQAKKSGVDVTCETGPHYLMYTDMDLKDEGRYKMNPPIRAYEDREALVEGVLDGTIDMMITDHAPHSRAEKSKGLAGSAFGITGIETCFPMLYEKLVRPGIIPLERILTMLTDAPNRRFHIDNGGNWTVFDMDRTEEIREDGFISLGNASPFWGEQPHGVCLLTVYRDRIVYEK